MTISAIHSYLVHPAKNVDDRPEIGGTKINRSGKLFEMLREIYDRAERECHFEICFAHKEDGEQSNEFRTLMVEYLKAPSISTGRKIANQLQSVTTNRSGLGLLFLIVGSQNGSQKIVISRFPADEGIVATENQTSLDVEFFEQVFMRSAKAYKAAVYSGTSFEADFWTGGGIDKQINDAVTGLSGYWVRDFLRSEFKTTGAAGTHRIAIAIREAINHSNDLVVKDQLIAASKLVVNQGGRLVSASQLAESLHLSEPAKAAFKAQFKKAELFNDKFQFDAAEFNRHISYQTVELDNGGMLTARSDQFDKVFHKEAVKQQGGKIRFLTEGKIVNQKFKQAKI